MKKFLTVLFGVPIAAMLAGCGAEETKPAAKSAAETTAVEAEVTEEKEAEKVEAKPAPKEPIKTEITFAEFDKKYTKDPQEKQWLDGLFEFRDGTKVNTDLLFYSASDIFDYASVIVYEGKIAHMQLETVNSINEIEKGLGISFSDDVIVDPNRVGFDIIFNEKFKDENIARFPNEWN